MRNLFANTSFQMLVGEIISGTSTQARTLRLHSGCAWVTIEGVAHDYWLAGGDTLTVPAARLVVIEAQISNTHLQATSLEIAPPGVVPALAAAMKSARTLFRRMEALYRKVRQAPATDCCKPAKCHC